MWEGPPPNETLAEKNRGLSESLTASGKAKPLARRLPIPSSAKKRIGNGRVPFCRSGDRRVGKSRLFPNPKRDTARTAPSELFATSPGLPVRRVATISKRKAKPESGDPEND